MFSFLNPFSNASGGGSSSGGGGTGFPQVNNYSSLPPANSNVDVVYCVLNPEGTWLINRKEAGLWKSNGSTWNRLGNWLDAFTDGNFTIFNSSDITKIAKFNASAISTATAQTYTLPNQSGILALTIDLPRVWDVQDIYTHTDGTVYGGQKDLNTLDWRIRKVTTSEVVTTANHQNNLSVNTYSDAWFAKLTLNYA